MTKADDIPDGDSGIRVVGSMDDFFGESFSPLQNLIVYPRTLLGDFNAVAEHLGQLAQRKGRHMEIIDYNVFEGMTHDLTGEAAVAAQQIFDDMKMFSERGRIVHVKVIPDTGYFIEPQQEELFKDSVYLWHADPRSDSQGTILCSYNEPKTERLRPDDAVRVIDIPEMRETLRASFEKHGGKKPDKRTLYEQLVLPDRGGKKMDFETYLEEECRHWYVEREGAEPFTLPTGAFARHAGETNETGAKPHVHRTPREIKGGTRLLLVR